MKNTTIIAASAIAVAAGSASATTWSWTWDGSSSSIGIGGGAALATAAMTSFDDVSNMLHWEITYGDQNADGLWAVINPGPYPSSIAGRDAILYMDGTGSDIRFSIMAYNASGDLATSQVDGDHSAAGIQAPDYILASDTGSPASWLHGASIVDNVDGTRSFSFDIDTSAIMAHNPMWGPAAFWRGMGFQDQLGVWVHSVEDLTTSYDANGNLTQWDFTEQSFFDDHSIPTIPTPGSLALLGLGGGLMIRRRRCF